MKQSLRIAIVLAAFLLIPLSKAAVAQREGTNQASPTPNPVAKRTDIYCTGFIADAAPRVDLQVIGGEKENSRQYFAEGDVVFLNQGREKGIQSGSVYYVIRPLGEITHPFTKKRMGVYVRELGLLRVLETQEKTATAEIFVSCDTIEFGDLLKPYEEMTGPGARDPHPLPRYAEGSGGTSGRIVYSRGQHEYLSANQIVFIDLGRRQGIEAGDNFNIFRTIGRTEGITKVPTDNVVHQRDKDFGSNRYRGGDYAISATHETNGEVLAKRPAIPRKVLGEMIILKVENSTAVALITRTTEEINIGDFVERAN